MVNFTIGPVQMTEEIRRIGAEELPYFRTPEFSVLMKENEAWMNRLMKAETGSRSVFLTGSGTAAMEAAVINLFTSRDRLLIVNGGSFGARFVKICQIHQIPYEEIQLESGKALTKEQLAPYARMQKHSAFSKFTGFLVNAHETSTGVLYDMELIGRFCKENKLWLVVDAISSFLADEFCMEKWGVDLVLTGSQKALALPPGIAILVLNRRAAERVRKNEPASLYFDLKEYLKDGERGQTPFTPAVGILLQLHARLKMIAAQGEAAAQKDSVVQKDNAAQENSAVQENNAAREDSLEQGLRLEQEKIRVLAEDFRNKINDLPFEIVSESLSNAETPLHPTGTDAEGNPVSAYRIFQILKDEYGMFICPNGGALADTVFRVGHIGNLTAGDNDKLIAAWKDMQRRGLL